MTELRYRERMAFNFGWKAALGAGAAYLLNEPTAFGALLAVVVGSAVYLLLSREGLIGDQE